MHHRSFFLLEELVSQSEQFFVETKDFIHGKVDWFKNPIPAPDAFEDGKLVNILTTIKIDISTNSEIVEEIMLGASCSPEEVNAYKAMRPRIMQHLHLVLHKNAQLGSIHRGTPHRHMA